MKWFSIFALFVLTACANPPKPVSTAAAPAWSGKLSINTPTQQTTAGFTLTGDPLAGQLDLFTPLGGKAAQVTWGAGFATITDGKMGRMFPDLATALREVANVDIPISNLFNWLQGKKVNEDKALETSMGWEADLTRLEQGRITAVRLQPLPRIELRVVLEQ